MKLFIAILILIYSCMLALSMFATALSLFTRDYDYTVIFSISTLILSTACVVDIKNMIKDAYN